MVLIHMADLLGSSWCQYEHSIQLTCKAKALSGTAFYTGQGTWVTLWDCESWDMGSSVRRAQRPANGLQVS